MATLQELMADFMPSPVEGQTKVAAATKTASTAEIDKVLEDLGLASAESVKTASENVTGKQTGETMNLMDIYNEVVGTPAVVEAPTEKTAAAVESAAVENDAVTEFGGLVGEYFNIMHESLAKEAADLEVEAGKGESPMAHTDGNGSMQAVLGKPADAHLPVNHSASSGAALKVTTQGHSPYSLAVKQKILKRMAGEGIVGEQK